jgi:mono/diheme cytochrome c family protein
MVRRAGAIAAAALVAGCVAEDPADRAASDPLAMGAAIYAESCVACHGEDGRGDGPLADGLAPAPPDLSRIAARNGGDFPMAQVMSTIDGYRADDGSHDRAMPEFGAELSGRTVLFDSGDGIPTPTPEWLVALGLYLQSLQR